MRNIASQLENLLQNVGRARERRTQMLNMKSARKSATLLARFDLTGVEYFNISVYCGTKYGAAGGEWDCYTDPQVADFGVEEWMSAITKIADYYSNMNPQKVITTCVALRAPGHVTLRLEDSDGDGKFDRIMEGRQEVSLPEGFKAKNAAEVYKIYEREKIHALRLDNDLPRCVAAERGAEDPDPWELEEEW